MHKIAIVITSALEGAGQSAIYRGLMFADELQRHGDDVTIVFDGAGSAAAAQLLRPSHALHRDFLAARAQVRGVCRHCALAYGVLEVIEDGGLEALADDRGHASLRMLLEEGRQIVSI